MSVGTIPFKGYLSILLFAEKPKKNTANQFLCYSLQLQGERKG